MMNRLRTIVHYLIRFSHDSLIESSSSNELFSNWSISWIVRVNYFVNWAFLDAQFIDDNFWDFLISIMNYIVLDRIHFRFLVSSSESFTNDFFSVRNNYIFFVVKNWRFDFNWIFFENDSFFVSLNFSNVRERFLNSGENYRSFSDSSLKIWFLNWIPAIEINRYFISMISWMNHSRTNFHLTFGNYRSFSIRN